MSGVQLSLIIPAYNCEGFIAGTLASAIAYLERRREPGPVSAERVRGQ